ncbi:MAG: DCC1-like thiol-disulfide oxidoreductase family protein [Verrucomicrobiota bacterium]
MMQVFPTIVANPPERPILLWDGDCRFCCRCAAWIQQRTGSRVDFAPYQEMLERFPELDEAALSYAVHYLDEHGRVLRAGEAVLVALERTPKWSWAARWYYHIPPFAWMIEAGYWVVARNRSFFSKLFPLKGTRPAASC